MKQYKLSITDETGSFICYKVPFDENRLIAISGAAGGLGIFIQEYNVRMRSSPCSDCDCYEPESECEGLCKCEEFCDDFGYYQHLLVQEEDRQSNAK